jgi:hypothetical protein
MQHHMTVRADRAKVRDRLEISWLLIVLKGFSV